MWSEWIYKGAPKIGDWVLVHCKHEDTKERVYFEGMVSKLDEENWICEIVPQPPDDNKYFAIRYKIKYLPEKDLKREKERELSDA